MASRLVRGTGLAGLKVFFYHSGYGIVPGRPGTSWLVPRRPQLSPVLGPFLLAGKLRTKLSGSAGNPATGDFSDAKVIRKFGEVPDDLSAV